MRPKETFSPLASFFSAQSADSCSLRCMFQATRATMKSTRKRMRADTMGVTTKDMISDRKKMIAGPQLHANWLMPMLAARCTEALVSEM